jgi:single-strand DNA-binding protein
MDLNKVMIIGRLTRDPELRTIPSGQNVASFSVATSQQWKDASGQLQSRTEYHNVVAWRKLADIVGQYLKKGKQVYIEGRLQTRSWDDQSGNKKYRTEIIADNMIMLGSPTGQSASEPTAVPASASATPAMATAAAPAAAASEEEINIEDIPF